MQKLYESPEFREELIRLGAYRAGSSPFTTGIWQSVSEDDGLTWGVPEMVNDVATDPRWRGDSGLFQTRAILTVEDHYAQGGLGDAVLSAPGPQVSCRR